MVDVKRLLEEIDGLFEKSESILGGMTCKDIPAAECFVSILEFLLRLINKKKSSSYSHE